VEDRGLYVIRVDWEQHDQKVDDFIIVSISGTPFTIADVYRNPPASVPTRICVSAGQTRHLVTP
jgi:hypothetical protein